MQPAAPYPTRTTPHFQVRDVDFAYPDGQPVFRGLNLAAHAGEFLVLLGPSGCGKTTLLNLLAGFMQPDRGHVCLASAAVQPENPALGYVFQSPQLFPWLNALDNVRFGLRMAGHHDAAEQRERALHYLALVGLADAAGRLPHQLSGGMQQRVALARTLALEPTVLLMDEPFAALDAITRMKLNEETLRLWSLLKQTVIFITHDIDEAVFLADRVVVLAPAPGGIRSELNIDLPRQRSQATRRLAQFAEYRNTLTECIAGLQPAACSAP
ncbi:Bicarbonate transport ATP-binding protein CmpD [Andreprevotia sp. IGB-42]|uniref:ABC transporter ATP-binding protein n=1 Tax=Andreprevotia sp. IGB-42 TaxID=2497473 RepID=UPI00135801A7|nr:ABC transporter ATP-binding protein [Andreprevotia sp. IGB-42]KAF0813727.1 Bicarbonate transport ATP-binding protein CmpD [Andreprevotia sp. IGB-42]